MLRALKELLDALAPTAAADAGKTEQALQLATAVLLVEVMRADPQVTAAERDAVLAGLHRKFASLDADELSRLLALAEETARSANDFFAFTSTLNDRFSHPQKIRMVELMWQVAYADGSLAEGENHVISKLAGLLHVTHGEYIAAKLRAREASGLPPPP
jgi:uncharacterized tellurite resistance protein B-like protein